jgi:nuclear pore complex protein Nup155
LGEIPLPKSVQEALEPPYPAGTLAEARVTSTGLLSELVTQYVCPRRRFVLMTNAGLVRFEKARPIDILRSLLEKNIPEQIEEFFKSYGPIEAAAMCVALAVSGTESNAVILAAKRAFDDPRLTGEPTIVEDSFAQNQENNGGSFNMGRAIVQPVLTFSSAQRGLFLFTARIMSSTWERPIIVPVRAPAQAQLNSNARPTSPAMMIANKALGAVQAAARYMSEEPALVCSMDATLLATLQDRLLPLVTFLRQRRPRISSGVDMSQTKRRRVRSSGSEMTALQEEERSLSALSAMVSRTAQALSLISIVIADERFSRVADMLPSAVRKELSQVCV